MREATFKVTYVAVGRMPQFLTMWASPTTGLLTVWLLPEQRIQEQEKEMYMGAIAFYNLILRVT